MPSKAKALDPQVLADSTAWAVQCAKTFTTQTTQPDGSVGVGDYPVQVLNFHIKAWDDAVAKQASETRTLQVQHTAKVNAEEERVAQLKTSALQLACLLVARSPFSWRWRFI